MYISTDAVDLAAHYDESDLQWGMPLCYTTNVDDLIIDTIYAEYMEAVPITRYELLLTLNI